MWNAVCVWFLLLCLGVSRGPLTLFMLTLLVLNIGLACWTKNCLKLSDFFFLEKYGWWQWLDSLPGMEIGNMKLWILKIRCSDSVGVILWIFVYESWNHFSQKTTEMLRRKESRYQTHKQTRFRYTNFRRLLKDFYPQMNGDAKYYANQI